MKKGLCELCNPKQWKTISSSELMSSGYPVYGANGIIGYYDKFNHEKETILITCRGATCGVLNICTPYSYVNGNAMALDDLSPEIDIKYLYFFLQNRGLEDAITGSAQPQIVRQSLKNIQVTYPSIKEQQKIAKKLDKLNVLLSLRKQQLVKLDELVKVRFVETFGNPVRNTMGWIQGTLRSVTTKIGSGATPKGGRESYQKVGISLIRSMNVYDGQFLYKELAHLTNEQASQLDGVTIETDDVLVNITGASVARSCVVPDNVLPARVNQHVAIIRCNPKALNPTFANEMIINNDFKRKLLQIGESGGATRQAITKKQLEDLLIILPPLKLQNEFAAFVERVDQQKQTVQQSLDKLELLKKALMQEYFG